MSYATIKILLLLWVLSAFALYLYQFKSLIKPLLAALGLQ